MKKLKKVDFKILAGLMKNAKISDRKLADNIGVSQPTITRRRAFLEEELSLHYTAIPDFSKIGMEIMAFHYSTWKPKSYETLSKMEDFQKRVDKWISDHSNIIFASSGQGLGMSRTFITIHHDYSDLVKFKAEAGNDWGQHFGQYETFIVSLKSDKVKRHPTFKYLADYIQSVNSP